MVAKFFKSLVIIILGIVVIAWMIFATRFIVGTLDALRWQPLNNELKAMTSDELMKKLYNFSPYVTNKAYFILIDRKDKRILPYVYKNFHSWQRGTKISAIQSLAELGETDSIPLIVDVMEKQKDKTLDNDLYKYCEESLAILNYQPIWDIAIKYSDSRDGRELLRASYLFILFDKKESLPYLQKIKDRIEKNDYAPYLDYKHIGPNGKPAQLSMSVDQIEIEIKKLTTVL